MPVTTDTRRTGTIFEVVDQHLNDWADFAGIDINVPVAYQEADTSEEWEQAHWSFRGQAAMVKTVDGSKIVRVRLGDGSDADRTIYKQEITDPTDPAQWTAWTQLYSGDHYAVAIEATTGSTFRVIHAKSDGIYVNNSLALTVGSVVRIKPILFWTGAIKYQVVSQDPDGFRKLDWFHVSDITSPSAAADSANYRWYRCDLFAVNHDQDGAKELYSFRALAETQARSHHASEQLITTHVPLLGTGGHNQWANADYLHGPSGQAGYRELSNLSVCWDGPAAGTDTIPHYYFLFWSEQHHDVPGNNLSNLTIPLFWSRAWSSPQDWSEPTPVGYSIWGVAGMVFSGSWVYLAGNGRVLRRPAAETSIDLSNYVIDGRYSLPRESQPGTASLTLANPANIVGDVLGLVASSDGGLTERRVNLSIGLRRPPDTDWTWKHDSEWWISALAKSSESDQEHVTVELGDFWHRLSTPFRGVISIPGRLEWNDWLVGGSNRIDNNLYTNAVSEFRRVGPDSAGAYSLQTLAASDTLFTGWRGENGFIRGRFSVPTGRIVFRYQDQTNYYYAEKTATQVRVGQVIGGVTTLLGTANVASTGTFWLDVQFRWSRINVYYNFTLVLPVLLAVPVPLVGFVGFGSVNHAPFEITSFHLDEWNRGWNSAQLLFRLLNYVGIHQIRIDLASATDQPQINVLWGPQSDLDTPAKAFSQLLGGSRLDAAYDPDYEPGYGIKRIIIGRFEATEEDVRATIENDIISQEQVSRGDQRPNIVAVDGNINSWTEYDRRDLIARQRAVTKYLDRPELNTPGEVRTLAEHEVLDARRYNSPGGQVVWRPEFSRLQPYFWVDKTGSRYLARMEGLAVEWNQSGEPFQRATLDMGTMVYCPPSDDVATYIARDTFQRTVSTGWSNAQIGGDWVVTT